MAMDWKKGVSLSMYQNAGEQEFETNWSDQVRRKKDQSPFPDAKDVIGISSDFWNRCVAFFVCDSVSQATPAPAWCKCTDVKHTELNLGFARRYHVSRLCVCVPVA